jgi:hypothetical protein
VGLWAAVQLAQLELALRMHYASSVSSSSSSGDGGGSSSGTGGGGLQYAHASTCLNTCHEA